MSITAGFVPIAAGTELDGSICMPSTRAALYWVKPTHGTVPGEGIMPAGLSDFSESMGPLAKCVEDLVHLLDVLVDEHAVAGKFTSHLLLDVSDLRV